MAPVRKDHYENQVYSKFPFLCQPVRLLQRKKRDKNNQHNLVLFNDKIALFKPKKKGKKLGLKVIGMWSPNRVSVSLLEIPTSSPIVMLNSANHRSRSLQRITMESSPVISPGRHSFTTHSPSHGSPRSRQTRSYRDIEALEAIEEGRRSHNLLNILSKLFFQNVVSG